MSKYLTTAQVDGVKLKDIYRMRAPYDENTGDFMRKYTKEDLESGGKPTGEYVGNDVYIDCVKDNQIYDINPRNKIMQVYFPNRTVGRGIVKKLYDNIINKDYYKIAKKKTKEGHAFYDYTKLNELHEKDDNWIIFNIDEDDDELYFDFNLKDIKTIAKYVKPRKPYANKTPYAKRYLPSYEVKLKEKKALEAMFVKYEMPKGVWNTVTKEKSRIAKKNKIKITDSLNFIYGEYGNSIKRDLIAESEEQKEGRYKVHHYIDKIGLFDDFLTFLKSM